MYIFIYAYLFGWFFLLAKYELFKGQSLSRNSKMKGILLQLVSMSVSSTLHFIVFLTTLFSEEIIALGSEMLDSFFPLTLERAEVMKHFATSTPN